MRYAIWVSAPGGDNRLALTDTTDEEKASQLVATLVAMIESESIDIGVSITKEDSSTTAKSGEGNNKQPPAKHGQRPARQE